MLECFVDQIVFQSPNMMQVTIAIKVSQWEKEISSGKIKRDHIKKGIARKSQNGLKKLRREHYSLSGINK